MLLRLKKKHKETRAKEKKETKKKDIDQGTKIYIIFN